MENPKPILDYSSQPEEDARDRKEEEKRRELLDAYNESTFGEKHPIISSLVRIAGLAALLFIIDWFLPRNVGWPVGLFVILSFLAWEVRSGRFRESSLSLTRYLFWWW